MCTHTHAHKHVHTHARTRTYMEYQRLFTMWVLARDKLDVCTEWSCLSSNMYACLLLYISSSADGHENIAAMKAPQLLHGCSQDLSYHTTGSMPYAQLCWLFKARYVFLLLLGTSRVSAFRKPTVSYWSCRVNQTSCRRSMQLPSY